MKNVRIWFQKVGSAKYFSHLDLARCMSRVLKISKLPVWHTEGFNPRVYMTFAMPLSLGTEGRRECMDIRLTEEVDFHEVQKRLNQVLPSDLRVLEVKEPVDKFDEICWAEYEILMEGNAPEKMEQALERLFARENILVIKHSKKGDREFDIKPHFAEHQLHLEGEGIKMLVTLPSSVNGSVNPQLLSEALSKYEGMDLDFSVARIVLKKQDFSPLQ